MKKLFLIAILFSFVFTSNIISQKKETKKMTDSTTVAVIKTNMGTIEIELFAKETPKTVENFVGLANKGYYNGVIFHRVIDGFMIQGGDPTGTGAGGESIWNKSFEDEFAPNAVFDKPFILAMANRGKNTNGSQFFITTAPTYWLNGMHTIFGYVIGGKEVVKDIENVKTNGRSAGDKPLEDVKINKITIED